MFTREGLAVQPGGAADADWACTYVTQPHRNGVVYMHMS